MKTYKKFQKPSKLVIAVTALIFIMVALFSLGFWLTGGELTGTKIKLLKLSLLPVVSVNSHPVLFRDFWKHAEFSEKYFSGPEGKMLKPSRQSILDAYILRVENKILADRLGVKVSEPELTGYSNSLLPDPASAETGLRLQSGDSDKDFIKKEVIYPEILLQKLQIWFNGQEQYNAAVYQNMKSFVQKIQSGERFEDIATNFSQDAASKNLGGDLGFLTESQVLSELRQPIKAMKAGEIKILPSRFGVHLIKLVEARATEQNISEFHLQQVFLKIDNFEAWLAGEQSKFTVRQYINI